MGSDNRSSSLEQMSETRVLDANLKLSRHKVHLLSRFMNNKSTNPKLTQNQIAKKEIILILQKKTR